MKKQQEEKRVLAQEKARIEPFGHFSLFEVRKFEREIGRVFQFYQRKKSKGQENLPSELIPIGEDFAYYYFISLEKQKVSYSGYVEMHLEHSLTEIENRIKRIDDEMVQYQSELKSSTGYIKFLKMLLFRS